MAKRVQPTSSYEVMIRYIVAVGAALVAIPKLADLAAPWLQRIREFQGYRDLRDDVVFAWIRSIAQFRVADLDWDTLIAQASKDALHAAGGDSDASPFEPLFGTVKARDAKQLGPAKALKFGTQLAAKIEELDDPALNALLPRLRAANEAVKTASEARDAAFEKVLLQNITRVKRLKALQEEISNTELDILTRFKGRHDLVNVILGGGKIADLDFDGLAAPADPPPDEA